MHLLDDILDWYDAEAAHADRRVTGYRRLGLARSLLRYGMQRAAQAGATEMLVTCLGAPAHTAARALYYDAGFRPFTRELPHIKTGVAPRAG